MDRFQKPPVILGIIALLLGFMLFGVKGCLGITSPVGEFADPNLEAIIREELDKPEERLSEEDLASIVSLVASEAGIKELEGIEHLINLERLNLRANEITVITALGDLTKLEDIRLNDNKISDLSPLEGLTNLRNLILADNEISDLSPLLALPNLERLNIRNNLLDLQDANIREQIDALTEAGAAVSY